MGFLGGFVEEALRGGLRLWAPHLLQRVVEAEYNVVVVGDRGRLLVRVSEHVVLRRLKAPL